MLLIFSCGLNGFVMCDMRRPCLCPFCVMVGCFKAYCHVKCFYFEVTYNVAVDSDSVGPSFKDRYSQLC